MKQDIIVNRIDSFKKKYVNFKDKTDYHVFTLLCMKYFFFCEDNAKFDKDEVIDYLTDGANDGGIDAIFNDPNSEDNDVIIMQSKYYNKSRLKINDIIMELHKIKNTLNSFKEEKFASFNKNLVMAYKNSINQKNEIGTIRICFFTTYQGRTKENRDNIIKEARELFRDFDIDIDIYFKKDIENQIELCENGKLFIEEDKLIIDEKNNYLKYNSSVIVNISAKSLQDLYYRKGNNLLGMNLRYYVRQKLVDSAIESTIKNEPQKFWYKNNGIIIACENYNIEDKTLRLKNFSIINGGQTTTRIGKIDIDEDFYLQCKVIVYQGSNIQEKSKFVYDIAEASNAQKPIKKADLKANAPEQLLLKENLAKVGVYYITKRGEVVPKQYKDKLYKNTKLDEVGKLSLAGILQMPGSARSNSAKMYDSKYDYIFKDVKAGVIADLLKIDYYYKNFLKNKLKEFEFEQDIILPMIKNGRTFQLACIVFLLKIKRNIFLYNDIARLMNDISELKNILKKVGDMEYLIKRKINAEEEIFYKIFSLIGKEVLGYCFQFAKDVAMEKNETIVASDYLKSDNNYYRKVIQRLWIVYNSNKELNDYINKICAK